MFHIFSQNRNIQIHHVLQKYTEMRINTFVLNLNCTSLDKSTVVDKRTTVNKSADTSALNIFGIKIHGFLQSNIICRTNCKGLYIFLRFLYLILYLICISYLLNCYHLSSSDRSFSTVPSLSSPLYNSSFYTYILN